MGANPKSFNDPFEFVVRDSYRITEDGKVEPLSKKEKDTIATIKEGIANFGVTCFSECEDEGILLWSHYSSNHAGMCLTFEIEEPRPDNLFKVGYNKSIS